MSPRLNSSTAAWYVRAASRVIPSVSPASRISAGRSCGVTSGPSARTAARSITFSSSRTFPGQAYRRSADSVSGVMPWSSRLSSRR